MVGVYDIIGIEITLRGVEAVPAKGGSRIVVDLVAIVHLLVVEHLLARHRVGDIKALDGTLLILIGFTGQPLAPVDMRCHGVAVLVLRDYVSLITAIVGIGKAGAEDGVAHPHDKLLVLRVCDLRLIHPESVYGDIFYGNALSPKAVALDVSHLEIATVDTHHAIRSGLGEGTASHTDNLTASARHRRGLRAETARKRQRHNGHAKQQYDILHR